MTAAQQKFKETIEAFVPLWDAWENEIAQLSEYIEEQREAGKQVAYLEIRRNNNIKRREAIERILQAATDAIYSIPQRREAGNENEQSAAGRVRICDLPARSNEWYLQKIYEILTNE